MRVRVRGPNGQSTLILDDKITVGELKIQLSEATSLPTFTTKLGAPPLPLETIDLDLYEPDFLLSDTGIKLANSLLTLSAKERDPTDIQGAKTLDSTASQLAPASASKATPRIPEHLSLQRAPLPSFEGEPPEIFIPEWGMNLVLRVMPDDNSCLFRALGTCLLTSDIDSATELRDIVASTILAQPDKYSEAMLGMSPTTYTRKIKSPDAWGGEIEISIIAEYFDVNIETINVKDQKVYSYNSEAKQRVIIIYSGIHYDALAMVAPGQDGLDIKQFDSGDAVILEKGRQICKILSERHYFTDTNDFSIACQVAGCGWKGNGEKAAEKHAMSTGHYEFGEHR